MQWFENLLGGDNRSFQLAILVGVVAVVLLVLVVLYRLLLRQRLRLPKSARTRQSRLALVDAHSLDGQRQLVLIRRDNVEHLVMIGGPNDVLLESHIVRSTAASLPAKDREGPAAAKPVAPAAQQAARSLPASGVAPAPSGETVLASDKALAAIPAAKRAPEAQPRPIKPDPVVNQPAQGRTEPAVKLAPAVAPSASTQRPQPANNLPPPLEKPAPAKPVSERTFIAPAPRPADPAPASAPKPAPAPAAAPKEDDIETLEAEMARLLGRAP